MKCISAFCFAFCVFINSGLSQPVKQVQSSDATQKWDVSIDANVTVTLNSYSDSWVGDESGSFTWASQLLALAKKQLIENIFNQNTLKLAFGQTRTQDPETNKWQKPRLSVDQIDLESFFRFTFEAVIDPYASLRLRSQFNNGVPSNDQVKYFNPIIGTESVGFARQFLGQKDMTLTSRFGFAVNNEMNRRFVTHHDGGLEFVTEYFTVMPNNIVTLNSKLFLFQALFTDREKTNDYWKALDVDWQNNLTLTVNKYVMVSLVFQMLYDKNVVDDLRMKEVVALGLTYNLKSQL